MQNIVHITPNTCCCALYPHLLVVYVKDIALELLRRDENGVQQLPHSGGRCTKRALRFACCASAAAKAPGGDWRGGQALLLRLAEGEAYCHKCQSLQQPCSMLRMTSQVKGFNIQLSDQY